MPSLRRTLKYAGLAVVGLVLVVGAGFATGLLGVPTVDAVENRFGSVNDTTTTIDTDLTVRNPNPVGVSLGGLAVDYTVGMNDVPMANGSKDGLSIGSGRSTITFQSHLQNDRIPRWWYTHVDAGETTEVAVDVDITHSALGGRSVSVPQEQTIQTDVLGQFNDSTTRPIDADAPLVDDPVLYLNETAAWYGEDVTRERTPLELAFTVHNPKLYPYAVTEVGYEIEMNGVRVGEGSSERGYAIPPRGERTIQASTAIRNQRLDEWWVSHLERDQVTNLTVDVYVVVDPDATEALGESIPEFRIDSDRLDYETTIETDIFGTKADDGLPPASADGGSDSGDGAGTDGGEPTPARTETRTADGSTETATPTEPATPDETGTATETPTPTEADDGILPVG